MDSLPQGARDIIKKYYDKHYDLQNAGRTGYECPNCQRTAITKKLYGLFCATCGVERLPVLAIACGVPVYDRDDFLALVEATKDMHMYSPYALQYPQAER